MGKRQRERRPAPAEPASRQNADDARRAIRTDHENRRAGRAGGGGAVKLHELRPPPGDAAGRLDRGALAPRAGIAEQRNIGARSRCLSERIGGSRRHRRGQSHRRHVNPHAPLVIAVRGDEIAGMNLHRARPDGLKTATVLHAGAKRHVSRRAQNASIGVGHAMRRRQHLVGPDQNAGA